MSKKDQSSLKTTFSLILTTVPDQATGENLAHLLLENRAAACVTIIGQGESYFWWEGKVQKESEFVLLIKTRSDNFSRVVNLITRHHPYEVPEIISLPLQEGYQPYLAWLTNETTLEED
jgi:periplasmic divalent cation tolerance protein